MEQSMSVRRGFTLLELLTVMAIISFLLGIILPSLSQARRNAERTTCATHLREVGLALRSYLDYNNDVFPYASFMPSYGPFPLDGPEPLYINNVLRRDTVEANEVFRCPGDRPDSDRPEPNQSRTYFDSEGSSYEYRWPLGGLSIKEFVDHLAEHLGWRVSENTIWIFRDYENFHAPGGTPGARRYLYIDGHVTDFEQ